MEPIPMRDSDRRRGWENLMRITGGVGLVLRGCTAETKESITFPCGWIPSFTNARSSFKHVTSVTKRMKKPVNPKILILCFLVGIQLVPLHDARAERPRSEVSLGFLTHKTGLSLVDYNYTVFQTEDHDFSVGVGTLLAAGGTSIAWKYYAYRGFADFYSVVALQFVSGMSDAPPKMIPFVSLGMEYQVFDGNYINVGVNQWVTTGLRQINEFRQGDYMILPQVSWGWRW